MILKLAWRNIWRNKRRTLITASSIMFAVLFASFMEALQQGAWNNMIRNVVNYYVGYAQIQPKGYREEQTLNKAFVFTTELEDLPEKYDYLKGLTPRLESYALASTGQHTMGALVVGVEPQREDVMTGLSKRLTAGSYFQGDSKGVLVAEGVAQTLDLELGDTLLLISQGFRGVNAAGKYPIFGLLHFPSPELNNSMVYMPLLEAQWFYGAEGRVTTLVLNLESDGAVQLLLDQLRSEIDTSAFDLLSWQQIMPELLEAKALDSAGNIIVYLILYMIIAFGIFGTILMLTKEREFELGVLTAIGTSRPTLSLSIWLEIVWMGLLGAVAGILLAIPVVGYFNRYPIRFTGEYAQMLEQYGFEPIFPAEFDPVIFLAQALVVFLMTAVLGLWPVRKVFRLQAVKAMRK